MNIFSNVAHALHWDASIPPLGHLRILLLVGLAGSMGLACQHRATLSRSQSGGLGLNQTEWEQVHGRAVSQDSAYARYRLDEADVSLNFSGTRCGTDLWVQISNQSGVSLDRARQLAGQLIPGDSTLGRTYAAAEGGIADSYLSESLAKLNEDWEGETSGSFTIWYSVKNGSVAGFTIRIGKGPLEH